MASASSSTSREKKIQPAEADDILKALFNKHSNLQEALVEAADRAGELEQLDHVCRRMQGLIEESQTPLKMRNQNRYQWTIDNVCFRCQEKQPYFNGLEPCACFEEDPTGNGREGGGVLLCKLCQEKLISAFCEVCEKLICDNTANCDCKGGCLCESCNMTRCFPCVMENEDDIEKTGCSCGRMYCPDCREASILTQSCSECGDVRVYCEDDYCEEKRNIFQPCHKRCGQPVCSRCVHDHVCSGGGRGEYDNDDAEYS